MLDKLINSTISLYPSEQNFIDEVVMGVKFPWFWQNQQTFNTEEFYNEHIPEWFQKNLTHYNGPFLSHTLLRRSEDENHDQRNRPPGDFSDYYEFFIELFHRFTVEQGIKYSRIFRANLNLNWYNGDQHTEPHIDHPWEHCNFIMYLNTCDQGQTIVWPSDFSSSNMIPCVKNTAVAFPWSWHAHRYPPQGERRVVFVVTYI
jgi:hypothetical protein